MNRTFLGSLTAFFAIVALFAVLFNSCTPQTVPYPIIPFANLRVMNFATTCGISNQDVSPMDAYFFPTTQSRPSQASSYNLGYGQASVYSDLLPTTTDSIVVTPHLIHTTYVQSTANLQAPSATNTGKYTFLVYTDPSSGAFVHTLLQDGVPSSALDTSKAYVRFVNMEQGSSPLTVHVNDPVTGDLIATSVGYGQVSTGSVANGYTPIHSVLDTSFAFIVTNASGTIIARLAYQTFTGGSAYTLVYGGDLCNTLATNPLGDSVKSASDTLRLRAFDDNTLGNDQTNPPAQLFRYNIINDIIPTYYPYDPNHTSAGDTSIGFLVNGNGFPEDSGFSIPPVPVYLGGGENHAVLVNGAYEVHYQSAVVPNPMVIQGTATNVNGNSQYRSLLFNAGTIPTQKFAITPLLQSSNNNKPWSIILYDTVPPPASVKSGNLDSALTLSHYAFIQMPDQSNPNYAKLVFVGGIVASNKTLAASDYALFYVQPNGGGIITPKHNTTGPGLPDGSSDTISVPIPAGTSESVMVSDSIGNKVSVRTFGNSSTFTAEAGGIYEIVAVGTKQNPQLLIMHVN